MSFNARNFNKILYRVLKHSSSIHFNSPKCLATFSKDLGSSPFLSSNNTQNISDCDFFKKLSPSSTQIRTKTYKPGKQRKPTSEYDSGSDTDSDDDIPQEPKELQHGTKVVQIQVDSLRCDGILKNGLGIPRNKLELSFYEGRIRINGRKIMRKSTNAAIGDEVDVIKKFDDENPELIHVGRVEVLKGKPTGDSLNLTIRKYKNLLIENYEKDPWEEKLPEEEQDEIEKLEDNITKKK